MKLRTALFALFACFAAALAPAAGALAACAEPGGMGGTGVKPEGGIGGTGGRADGGIGGTGIQAQTELGLIGVITGFGSICVNGVEVHYDSATPVSLNGQAASPGSLAVGQVVAVRAVGAGSQGQARAIDIVDAAIGPVTAVEGASAIQVVGQRVRIDPSTVFGPGLTPQALAQARVGDPLRVAGLRTAGGTIVATRIEHAPPDAAPLGAASAPSLGAGRFVVQGYVGEPQAGGQLRISGMPFAADAAITARLQTDNLVRVAGRTEANGNRVVERVEFLRSPLNPRPEGALEAGRPQQRESDDRRGREDEDRRGRDSSGRDGSGREGSGRDGARPEREDRSGRSGPDRPERVERGDRVERPDRSGRH